MQRKGKLLFACSDWYKQWHRLVLALSYAEVWSCHASIKLKMFWGEQQTRQKGERSWQEITFIVTGFIAPISISFLGLSGEKEKQVRGRKGRNK